MSDLSDEVERAVTHEWQTTRQICERMDWHGIPERCRCQRAYEHLRKYLPYGLIEKRIIKDGPGGHMAEWRWPDRS